MFQRYAARGGAAVVVAAGVILVLAACGASVRASAVTGPRCGAQTADVLAREAGYAAHQIYANEVHGAKVASDRHQVQSYAPLLRALGANDNVAVQSAVSGLVFSHTHIVRLRVSTGRTVRADIGGPYIIAPVAGTLRTHGRVVGHYVLSVQDDLGYVKLVTRFVGALVVMRREARTIPVRSALAQAPSSIPDIGPVTFHGGLFAAYSFDARSFPSGTLRVSLLVPVPAALKAETCAEVKAGEARLIAQRTARRYHLEQRSFYPYAAAVHRFTGARVYIHLGSRPLTGVPSHGPSHLPASGAADVGAIDFRVTSFHAPSSRGRVTVYVLIAE